jgi:hypothetical protein
MKARFAFSAVAWKTLRVSHIAHRLLLIDTLKRQKSRRILGSGFSGGVENALGLPTGLGHPCLLQRRSSVSHDLEADCRESAAWVKKGL